MNADAQTVDTNREPSLPTPVIKKMSWPFPIIWIIPIAAAAVAGFYLHQHHQERGVEITIQFLDVQGFKDGETAVVVQGVTVGKVQRTELAPDHQHVLAYVKLTSTNEFLARSETLFWIVRPEVSLDSIKGLNTLISGPFIQARPGDGTPQSTFTGLAQAPTINGGGIKLVLSVDQIGQLRAESPVFFRGVQVGLVQDIRLASDSTAANVTVFIWEKFKPLVRTHSKFWVVKGADIQGSIFSGLQLKLDSVRSLLTGGIAFATPEKNAGLPITEGMMYELNEKPEDDWLNWKPKIQLPAEEGSGSQQPAAKNPK